MIQKPSQSRRTLAWVLGVLMLASWATGFASTFTVKITPKNSGQVLWSTMYPTTNGVITGSGGTFPYTKEQTYVYLTLVPNTGGSIVNVTSDEGSEMPYLYGVGHNMLMWPGPGENSKKVTVTFSGGTTPSDPTGVFGFAFPTNNASLTAITDLSGTYTGVTMSVAHPRHYNVTVAQDESGKLSAMGEVDGIVLSSGPSKATVSGPYVIGAITTVNNQPTAQLKGKFAGSVDGAAATANGTAQGPVAVGNIGGTNFVTGTVTHKADIGGVPYSAKNTPLTLPVGPAAASHIHKSWSIALTITNTASAGAKSSIMSSALLILPNGDHISFPAKKTKYSAKGYKLSFKGGTNITKVPNAVDKKSKVSITGMTLTKTGTTWNPTAGTMSYQFLGQKGKADLMDFLGP
jgi:hypothetical protein